jgi:Tfp pilus assembly protein PilV
MKISGGKDRLQLSVGSPRRRDHGRLGEPSLPSSWASSSKPDLRPCAFTLIEVMLAITIFFMAMFAILGVLSSGVHAASILRTSGPTAGMVAGIYYLTNQIQEGVDAGDFSDIAGYEKYTWRAEATEVTTNGLYRMDFVVTDPNGNPSSVLTALFYKPGSGNNQRMGLQQQPH